MRKKLAVILAADAIAYSNSAARTAAETGSDLTIAQETFEAAIIRHGGRFFNPSAGMVLAEFPSAFDGLTAAIEAQEKLKGLALRLFRTALHLGEVLEDSEDVVLGDGVAVAVHLQQLAPVGGVCISGAVYDVVPSLTGAFKEAGTTQIHAVQVPTKIFMLDIAGTETPHIPPSETARSFRPSSSYLLAGAGVVSALILVAGSFWLFQPVQSISNVESLTTTVASPNEQQEPPSATDRSEVSDQSARAQGSAEDRSVEEAAAPAAAPVHEEAQQLLSHCRTASPAQLIELCERALASAELLAPERAETYARIGTEHHRRGSIDAAIAAFNRSIELNQTSHSYAGRGSALASRGDYAHALADLDEALRSDPANGPALNNRAVTRFHLGDLQAALNDANAAVKALPNVVHVWDTRAHIYERLGKRSAAIGDYRKALSLDPQFEKSRAGLKRLRADP